MGDWAGVERLSVPLYILLHPHWSHPDSQRKDSQRGPFDTCSPHSTGMLTKSCSVLLPKDAFVMSPPAVALASVCTNATHTKTAAPQREVVLSLSSDAPDEPHCDDSLCPLVGQTTCMFGSVTAWCDLHTGI